MDRRQFIVGVSSVLPAVSGCLGNSGGGSAADPAASPTRQEPPAGPVRCRGDPVSVQRAVTDTAGYEDNIEYFPSNETVRFVKAKNVDGSLRFGTWSFEQWGSITAAEVGLERVRDVTAERLGTDKFGSSMGTPPDSHPDDQLVIWVEVATRKQNGETVRTPAIPLARIADVAPHSAAVTVSLDGDTFSRSVPVFARHTTVAFG